MSDIIMYSTDCPKCKVLEKKLKEQNITFKYCKDEDKMISLGIDTVPVLEVDDEFLDFGQAITWINNRL